MIKPCVIQHKDTLEYLQRARYNKKEGFTPNLSQARLFTNVSCAKASYAWQQDNSKILQIVLLGFQPIGIYEDKLTGK